MKIPFLLFCFFTFYTSFGQKRSAETNPDVIEVTGMATNEIDSDQFFVSITLSEKSIDNRKYSILNAKYDIQIVLGIGLMISGLWTYLTSKDFIVVNGQKERVFWIIVFTSYR